MAYLTHDAVWVGVGFLGQGIFTARFLVQWAASEKKRESVVPVAFWWISLFGGVTLLSYAVHRRDPVIIFGQAAGLLVYMRNLMLVSKAARRAEKRNRRSADRLHPHAVPRPHLLDPSVHEEVAGTRREAA